MRLRIEIDVVNDAFVEDERAEIARILRALAHRLMWEDLNEEIGLQDINGNTVGHAHFKEGRR